MKDMKTVIKNIGRLRDVESRNLSHCWGREWVLCRDKKANQAMGLS